MKFSRTGRLIVSEESMEYCQFNCSWSNNQNFNYVAKYSLLQTRNEWYRFDIYFHAHIIMRTSRSIELPKSTEIPKSTPKY